MNVIDIDRFKKVLPDSESNLKRLKFLQEEASGLRIAVFGKYNHGKSTLLNALIGKDVFKTADKRETIKNAEYKHNDVIWVDTPGLDADVQGKDDEEAMKGAFEIADILYLVHNVKSGELDKYEMKVFRDLMKQDKNYRKKMFLILTQIDQVSTDQLEQVKTQINKQIKKQLPELTTISISAQRYCRGVSEGKPKFIELSEMDSLFTLVASHLSQLDILRKQEIKRLVSKVRVELNDWKAFLQNELDAAKFKRDNQQKQFQVDIGSFVQNIQTRVGE